MTNEISGKIRRKQTLIIALPVAVKDRWSGLQDAVNRAAKPFTGKEEFALSVMYLHDVMGAESALDRALNDARKTKPDIPLHGEFILTKDGPASAVSWWADASHEE